MGKAGLAQGKAEGDNRVRQVAARRLAALHMATRSELLAVRTAACTAVAAAAGKGTTEEAAP